MKVKAILASDIDNTLTGGDHKIPAAVIEALKKRYDEGWKIVFITGRTATFAFQTLKDIPFPYELSAMHGAETIVMPEEEILEKCYLPIALLNTVEEIYKEHDEYFLVYSGREHGDNCYYFPKEHSQGTLDYFAKLQAVYDNPWVAVEHHSELPHETVPLVRCFGDLETMRAIQQKVHSNFPDVHTEIISDVVATQFHLLFITHPMAQKGSSLERIIARNAWEGPIIAAGDDNNDITLFHKADYKIAVDKERGCEKLHALADIVAKPSKEMGIIEALVTAEKKLGICL